MGPIPKKGYDYDAKDVSSSSSMSWRPAIRYDGTNIMSSTFENASSMGTILPEIYQQSMERNKCIQDAGCDIKVLWDYKFKVLRESDPEIQQFLETYVSLCARLPQNERRELRLVTRRR